MPAKKQARVAASVAASASAFLTKHGEHTASVDRLLAFVGGPSFYDVVAKIDPKGDKHWTEMGRVQRKYAGAEAGFDPDTRAYSETMRLTLHAALIQHLADPSLRDDKSLFEMFLELHVTAFRENGGWFDNLRIGVHGALEVVEATPLQMAGHIGDLIEGSWHKDEATLRAAGWVKDARRAAVRR